MGADGSLEPVSRSITPMWQGFSKAGAALGQMCTFRDHVFVPVPGAVAADGAGGPAGSAGQDAVGEVGAVDAVRQGRAQLLQALAVEDPGGTAKLRGGTSANGYLLDATDLFQPAAQTAVDAVDEGAFPYYLMVAGRDVTLGLGRSMARDVVVGYDVGDLAIAGTAQVGVAVAVGDGDGGAGVAGSREQCGRRAVAARVRHAVERSADERDGADQRCAGGAAAVGAAARDQERALMSLDRAEAMIRQLQGLVLSSKQAKWEESDGGADVAIPNDNNFRDVQRADGNPLGIGAVYTVADAAAHTVRAQGQVLVRADSANWTVVQGIIVVTRVSDGFTVVGKPKSEVHSFGTSDSTTQPAWWTLAVGSYFALPAGDAQWIPKIQVACFGGFGGGAYTRGSGWNQVGMHRVA
jgi:hypothetical protein